MIRRKLLEDLKKHLPAKEISLIIGPRQAGKTTLMKKMLSLLREEGKKTLFINLDFESDKAYFLTQNTFIWKVKT